ncbi:MAG TPA: ABC transporter substrate-binding protein [Gaiellaceae bacterium]|nr:ABC transporter substrate-binding protein [Gaiellaceae bacterium]
MHKKLLPSLAAAVIGAGLLVGASSAGSAGGAAPGKAGGSEVKRGGTLRINLSTTDYEFLDPALSYEAPGWQVLFMTNLMLLNYPDKPAPEGSRLTPDAAGFPRISRDGKTYTFTVKKGLRFSDGSAVTAAAFKRAFERAASQQQASPAIAFLHDVVGADARSEGKASSVTGVVAKGQTLTIRLLRANPTFLAEVAMPFFAAVKPSMPIDPKGISVYPSAGPYHIASRTPGSQVVLERNRFYKGTRPANADRIVISTNTDLNQSLLQVRAAQVDYDQFGLPPTAHDDLSRQFGISKGGNGRYFVNTGINTTYFALNTSRPALRKLNLRQAINYAIDRPSMLRVAGKYAGKRTDQILAPNLQGFRDANIYPIKGANPAKGRQLAAGAKDDITLLHTTSPTSVARAQILKYNLEQIGLSVSLKPQPFGVAIKTAGTRGSDFDMFLIAWFADYPDPFDFINVLLDGQNIQEANNSNYSYFNSPKYNRAMTDAAKLSGGARYDAYGKLDVDMMKNAAPWAPLSNANVREFVSSRVSNYLFHPVYGGAIMNALAIK